SMQVSRTTKFTGVCLGLYVAYAVFIFFVLPLLIPDPVTLQRAIVAYRTQHLGNLSNFTIETGGTPVRSMLVTFRGSGAVELLDNLSHQPGCYLHYAPLIAYQSRFNTEYRQSFALDEITALYNCDYNQSLAMIARGQQLPLFRRFYGAQSRMCRTYSQEKCWNPDILAEICKLHPFINMAVYNMRLMYLARLLDSESLNLRILLLVRDPRATLYRLQVNHFCKSLADCNAAGHCLDMSIDFEVAKGLSRKYPGRFSILRYEDVEKNALVSIKEVFEFFGLPLTQPKVKSHPRGEWIGGSENWSLKYSTNIGNEWMVKMDPKQIQEVQNVCSDAMKLWGYRPIEDFSNFSPENFE
ncbi:hypothetical protein KR018_000502, partial [Drosophila ironensis]